LKATAVADQRLNTSRLELLPVGAADLASLQALFSDPEVRRHLWDDVAVDDVETDSAIRQSLRSFRAHGYGLWRLNARGEPNLAGCCGLREVGTEAELVVAIDPALNRRGYAREACLAVTGHALRRLRLPRVIAMCDVNNEAGRGLVASLGMREQHVTRASGFDRTVDVVLYEMTLADLPAPATVIPLASRREG
jgi:[ribosomal protein S5]-alanine N-acetyltransferase